MCPWKEGATINYEIRYMLMLLKSIINQSPIQLLRRSVNWERILSVSDYQNVMNLVYMGILGLEKEISEECAQQFYQKYKKELLLYESYKNAEEVILWQLEKHEIDALVLSDTSVRELYPMPEMASFTQIEILVDKVNLAQVYRLMRDMDYEQEDDRLGQGTVYVRVPGIRVVFYGEIPIRNKVIVKYFSGSLKKYLRMDNYIQQDAVRRSALGLTGDYSVKYRYIHILSDEEEYIYRVGRLVELYLMGVLKIRDVLEFWLFRKVLDEAFPWKAVKELMEKAKWTEFVHQAEVLSSLWFEEGVRQQYGIALELEEYILIPGQENKYLKRRLLPEEKARLDFYRRDRKEEWQLKKREWSFPPREYMRQFFPILDKYPFLLIFCWGIRWYRIYSRMFVTKCEKAWLRFRVRFLDIKEKIKGLIRRKEKESPDVMDEVPPGMEPKPDEGMPGMDPAQAGELPGMDAGRSGEVSGANLRLSEELSGMNAGQTEELTGMNAGWSEEFPSMSSGRSGELFGTNSNLSEELSGMDSDLDEDLPDLDFNLHLDFAEDLPEQGLNETFSGFDLGQDGGLSDPDMSAEVDEAFSGSYPEEDWTKRQKKKHRKAGNTILPLIRK